MDCNFTLCKRYLNGDCIKQVGEKCQLEQAKEIIKQLMYTPKDCIAWYCLCDKAEQFLKDK